MIEIDVGPSLFSGFNLNWHGIFSFIAVGAAVILVGRWARLRGLDPDDIYSIAIWAIIGGIVGARIVHVVDNWADIYSQRPSQIIAIWNGGIGVWGGIIGGFFGGALYAWRAGHPIGIIADITAPAMLFGQSIGRLGDIVNGEHCAKAADYFLGFVWTHPYTNARSCPTGWGDQLYAQPVILFEILWNTAALVIIWKFRGRLKPDGMLFVLYLALYAIGRFGITFLRFDRIWAFGMQEAHYIALLVLAITVPLLVVKARFTGNFATVNGLGAVSKNPRSGRRRKIRN